eukprot:scaffold3519_cov60-Cylindrotheca_fusiformis.AAC.2
MTFDEKNSSNNNNDGNDEGIQVICAGLGRTGTMSLTEALNMLGYKTYHYLDLSHHQAWADLADGKKSSKEIIEMIVGEGYNATLENPTSDIYQDLLLAYPNAKVILTVRDTPEAFCKSWKTLLDTMVITEQTFSWTFPSFFGYIPTFRNLKKIRYFMGTTHLQLNPGELTHGWRTKGDAWLAEQYEKHNQHVQDHVVKDNLLVFNVKEGWEPLCKFLHKEIPKNEQEFPNVQINTTSALLNMKRTFCMIVYLWIPTTMLTLGATMMYFWNPKDHADSSSSSLVFSLKETFSSIVDTVSSTLFPRSSLQKSQTTTANK